MAQLSKAIAQSKGQIKSQKVLLNQLIQQQQVEENKKQVLTQQYNEVLVNTYKQGGEINYLSVLFNATSWPDLISRVYEVKTVLTQNYNIQQQLAKENQVVKSKTAAVNQNMNKLQNMLALYNQDAQAKSVSAVKQQKILLGLNMDQRKLADQKSAQLAEVDNLQNELQAQAEEARMYAKYGPIKSSGNIPSIVQPIQVSSDKIGTVISTAEGFIGLPYVWGGTSPAGFDCSGLTQYAYRQIGVNLQRTSQEQFEEGVPVSANQLQPGDLVFFSTYTSGASHVGIYIGNGRMVNSEGLGLMITDINSDYWGPRYIGARRIVTSK